MNNPDSDFVSLIPAWITWTSGVQIPTPPTAEGLNSRVRELRMCLLQGELEATDIEEDDESLAVLSRLKQPTISYWASLGNLITLTSGKRFFATSHWSHGGTHGWAVHPQWPPNGSVSIRPPSWEQRSCASLSSISSADGRVHLPRIS